MNLIPDLSPISEIALDENWFSLRLRTWKAVAKAVKDSGVEQKKLAERIHMDPGQFNKVISGKKSNVTLRTLHNIARSANHRLRITLEPLAGLPKPNYSFDLGKKTETPLMDSWTTGTGSESRAKLLDSVL